MVGSTPLKYRLRLSGRATAVVAFSRLPETQGKRVRAWSQ